MTFRAAALACPLFLLGLTCIFRNPSTPEESEPEYFPHASCFAPGTSPEVIARAANPKSTKGMEGHSLLGGDLAKAIQLGSRWTRTATNGSSQGTQGLPVTVTWSFVPDGTTIPTSGSNPGENGTSNLRSFLAGIYGGSTTGPAAAQPWFPIFQATYDNLSSVCGINFVYEPNDDGVAISSSSSAWGVLGTRGDIRISGHYIDGEDDTLAYNYYPNYGDMVIDTADSYFNNTSQSSRRLRNVLEHETGHGLGLDHVCPLDATKLMEPRITLGFVGAQFDEIYSLQRHYGDIYEKANSARNNDTFANATPLSIPSDGTPWSPPQYLGIDDNSDIDYFAVTIPGTGSFTATITPSDKSYLEGEQNNDGTCSGGTQFDSATRHNLTLALYGPGQNLLATANANPAGQAETISMTLPSGTHYLRVTGGTTDANQLYTLTVSLDADGAILEAGAPVVAAELFSAQNGSVDPLETVVMNFPITNTSGMPASGVEVTLDGPASLIPLDTSASLGTIAGGAGVTTPFTFAIDGECGEVIPLSLEVTTTNSGNFTFPFDLQLGVTSDVLAENFDASASLPTGWQSATTGSGQPWTVSTAANDTPTRSVFTPNIGAVSQAILTSPSFPVATNSALSFRHFFNTEDAYDGGVLEISIDGGTWQDFETAGGIFTQGGYTGALRTGTGNPLAGRSSWEGNSGNFVTVTGTFPPPAIGQDVRLRWILASDSSATSFGWYLDSLQITGPTCDESGPAFSLDADATTLLEGSPGESISLSVTTELPVAIDWPITFQTTGTADLLTDFTGFETIEIPAFSDNLTLPISAVEDALVEGTETVTLSLPGATPIELTILESLYEGWAIKNLTGLPSGPDEDADGDLVANIIEYAHGTNAASADSKPPVLTATWQGGSLALSSPTDVPADVIITPESSSDLNDWQDESFTTISGFLLVTPGTPPQFFRLRYELVGP